MEEHLAIVFKLIDPEEVILNCSLVCKTWYQAIKNSKLWLHYCITSRKFHVSQMEIINSDPVSLFKEKYRIYQNIRTNVYSITKIPTEGYLHSVYYPLAFMQQHRILSIFNLENKSRISLNKLNQLSLSCAYDNGNLGYVYLDTNKHEHYMELVSMENFVAGNKGIIKYNKNGKAVSICGDYVASAENAFVDEELRKHAPFGWVTLLHFQTGEQISSWRAQNSDIFIVKLFQAEKLLIATVGYKTAVWEWSPETSLIPHNSTANVYFDNNLLILVSNSEISLWNYRTSCRASVPGQAFYYDPSLNTFLVANFDEINRYNLINSTSVLSCIKFSSAVVLHRSKWDTRVPIAVGVWCDDHRTLLQFESMSEILEMDYTVQNARDEEYPDSGNEDEGRFYVTPTACIPSLNFGFLCATMMVSVSRNFKEISSNKFYYQGDIDKEEEMWIWEGRDLLISAGMIEDSSVIDELINT